MIPSNIVRFQTPSNQQRIQNLSPYHNQGSTPRVPNQQTWQNSNSRTPNQQNNATASQLFSPNIVQQMSSQQLRSPGNAIYNSQNLLGQFGSPFLGSPQLYMAGNMGNPFAAGNLAISPMPYLQTTPQASSSSGTTNPSALGPELPCPCCIPGAPKCPCRIAQEQGYDNYSKEDYFKSKTDASKQLAREIRHTIKISKLEIESEDVEITKAVFKVSNSFPTLAACTPKTRTHIRSKIKACLSNKGYYSKKRRKSLGANAMQSNEVDDSLLSSDSDDSSDQATAPPKSKKPNVEPKPAKRAAKSIITKSKKTSGNLFGLERDERDIEELARPIIPEFATTNDRQVKFDLNDIVIIGQGRSEYDFGKVDKVTNDLVSVTYVNEKLVPLTVRKSKEVWKDDVLLNTIIMNLGKNPDITTGLKSEILHLTLELYPDEFEFS